MSFKRFPLLATIVVAAAPHAFAQDLFLARLSEAGGTISADSIIRLTQRVGYDNQPSFMPDGNILYTSMNAAGRADIWRYDVARKTASPVATTQPESEYSATLVPGGERISVVRVERDSTQRLWTMAKDGSDLRVLLENVRGVGYYAWLDAEHVAVYLLGNPSTLQLVDTRTGNPRLIAARVGRTIQKVPGRDAFTFVQNVGSDHWVVLYDVDSAAVTALVQTPQQNEFYTWTPGGTLLSAENSVLYAWDGRTPGRWRKVADFASAGVAGITRLAVSPDGKWLAIVAAD